MNNHRIMVAVALLAAIVVVCWRFLPIPPVAAVDAISAVRSATSIQCSSYSWCETVGSVSVLYEARGFEVPRDLLLRILSEVRLVSPLATDGPFTVGLFTHCTFAIKSSSGTLYYLTLRGQEGTPGRIGFGPENDSAGDHLYGQMTEDSSEAYRLIHEFVRNHDDAITIKEIGKF